MPGGCGIRRQVRQRDGRDFADLQLGAHHAPATVLEGDFTLDMPGFRPRIERLDEALIALDARVHRFIYRCAGNPYMEETLGRYFNLSLRIWHLVIDRLPHLFARVHEHDDLLSAIAAGEADRAHGIMSEHITAFEREIRGVL